MYLLDLTVTEGESLKLWRKDIVDEVTAQRQNRKNNLEMTQVIKLSKPIPETNFS